MPELRNSKHEAVLQAFLRDAKRVGWRAYKAVYRKSSQRASETAWSRLLKDAVFDARLKELTRQVTQAAVDAAVMDLQQVLAELSKLGRANMRNYFNADGSFVGIGNLSPEQTAAIAALEIEPILIRTGKGKTAKVHIGQKVKFKLHDKRGSLGELRRHLEPTKIEHSGTLTLEMLVGASMKKKTTPVKKAKAA